MNNTLCIITAQYRENYGTADQPHWKPKGSQTFNLMVDSDAFMYAEEQCVEAIKTLLRLQSNNHGNFEYVGHGLIFNKPIELDANQFNVLLQAECHREKEPVITHDTGVFCDRCSSMGLKSQTNCKVCNERFK